MAEQATKEAQRELEAMPDQGERCQYVLGVAEELSHLQSESQAIALLTKGGVWAAGIDDEAQRRSARLALAVALFNLNAYEGGLATLHNEGDPAWSSDTMLALASRGDAPSPVLGYASGASAEDVVVMPMAAKPAVAPQATPSSYGKVLGVDASFRGASRSRHEPAKPLQG